ncbi:MAG: glycosyltransferase family 2 protein [Saprospiraceae bacterium]|nr:glycosyltransferase family 2 protein [Saprospiraceae bacterium]
MPATHPSSLIPHPFTAIIISHNVADTIGPCVEALRKVCEEMLVLDTQSTDGTIEICERLGATVVQQDWLGYAKTKNIGNQMARHDWILSIDADEVLSDELIASLRNWHPEAGKVYALDRITSYCGKWIHHSGWYPDWKVRLFDRRHVEWQGDFVHETLHIPTDFQSVKLKGKLFHYSYKDSDDHLRRMEKYARLAAQEQFAKGKKANFVKRWLSPFARFFKAYFLKMGILDGRAGWVISWRNAKMIRMRYRLLDELWRTANK